MDVFGMMKYRCHLWKIKLAEKRMIAYTKGSGPRGGVVTQRIANPSTPVRFRAWPPLILNLALISKNQQGIFLTRRRTQKLCVQKTISSISQNSVKFK